MVEMPKESVFQKVLDQVALIPKGKVSTYGDIAKACGIKDVRIVGWALHTNKNPDKFPCHSEV